MADFGVAYLLPITTAFTLLSGPPFSHTAVPNTHYMGTINKKWDPAPKWKVLDPNKGQIWPRGRVGEYLGEVAGTIIFYNFMEYPIEANAVYGQLWPRGDFIPEVDS